VTRATRASLWTIEQLLPGSEVHLTQCRAAFASLLRVELAVLASERAAAASDARPAGATKLRAAPARWRPARRRPSMRRAV
jgi:hypothetical protein